MAKKTVKPQHHKSSRPSADPVEQLTMYAVNGLYFGVGAACLAADNAEHFVKKAVERGQQVDIFEGLGKLYTWQEKLSEKLTHLPEQPLKIIRSFIPTRREKDKDPMVVLEARLREEVMKAADRIQTPLKKNLQDLTRKVNNLSNLVGKMAAR